MTFGFFRTCPAIVVYCLSLSLLVSGCLGEGDDVTPVIAPSPTATYPIVTPSTAPGPTATATYTAEMEALLIPGPSLPAPPRFFFLNGSEIWLQPAEGDASAVIRDVVVGPWASSTDSSRIAAVYPVDVDGGSGQEIRVIAADGTASEPVYGPIAIDDRSDGTEIVEITWAWDNSRLAAQLADGSLVEIPLAENGDGEPQPIPKPDADASISLPRWAPNNAGLSYLAVDDEARGQMFVVPEGGTPRAVLSGDAGSRTVGAYEWLPGRGRIVFVEQLPTSSTGAPGSIFTIAPDGTALELLVSVNQFAPAASVGLIAPSRDGRQIAFTIHLPTASGARAFESLWVQTIDSQELVELTVEAGYRVTDLWWMERGLCWRGVDLGARGSADSAVYSGTEPFILGCSNVETGESTVVFRSSPRVR